MAVDDTWYLSKKGLNGERVKSAKHGRGKRWRVRYTDDGGQPKEQLFERKADADRWDANVRADVSRGVYVDPTAGKVTVSAYSGEWRANLVHRETTAVRFESAFRLHVDAVALGRMQIAAVRKSHIQAWVKDRSAVLQPSTLRVLYGNVASMFAAAVADRVIGASPCLKVTLPDVEESNWYIPSPEQVHALALAMPARLRALPILGAGTGVRQGEAWGLEVEHVDFLRREIGVVQALACPMGGEPYLGPPKTITSRRTVEMGQIVTEALARHFEIAPPRTVEILDATNPRRPFTREAKLLFANTMGKPLRRGYAWSAPWKAAVESVEDLPDDFGFHDLRHYFATLLIHAGASVKTVQKALGHSKPSITLDMYTHEWPDVMDRTRNLVDAALGTELRRAV